MSDEKTSHPQYSIRVSCSEVMECLLLLLFILKSIDAGVSPIYSPSFSKVSHVGDTGIPSNHPQDRLKKEPQVSVRIPEDSKTTGGIHQTSDTLISNEITVEPESEQIEFVHFPKKTENIELVEESDNVNSEISPDLTDASLPIQRGVYYVYHPNGLLQKVVFATKTDMKNGQYTANLNYQNVEPIVEPIYTYDPNTFVFQRLQLFPN